MSAVVVDLEEVRQRLRRRAQLRLVALGLAFAAVLLFVSTTVKERPQ